MTQLEAAPIPVPAVPRARGSAADQGGRRRRGVCAAAVVQAGRVGCEARIEAGGRQLDDGGRRWLEGGVSIRSSAELDGAIDGHSEHAMVAKDCCDHLLVTEGGDVQNSSSERLKELNVVDRGSRGSRGGRCQKRVERLAIEQTRDARPSGPCTCSTSTRLLLLCLDSYLGTSCSALTPTWVPLASALPRLPRYLLPLPCLCLASYLGT